MLSAQQVERYRWDGYLFPLPALSAGELHECDAGLVRFEDWLDAPLTAADGKWRSAGYVFLPWVAALVRHPRILDTVESLIGPDILVYTSTFFIKEANSPTFAAWHQDATYFGLDPHEQVTAWVALTEAGAGAGVHGSRFVTRTATAIASRGIGARSQHQWRWSGDHRAVRRGGRGSNGIARRRILIAPYARPPSLGAEPRRASPRRPRHQLHPGEGAHGRLASTVCDAGPGA